MVPAAAVDRTLDDVAGRLQEGDIVIDGGNSHYVDDIRRAKDLDRRGVRHANVGKKERGIDAETAPLREPERYRYDFDLADITELWRRRSVIASWLLDLCAKEFVGNPDLSGFAGRVADSGEGRWTIAAAIEEGTPAPVLSTALYQRFSSRGEDDFARRILSAMRYAFGGHVERPRE